MQGRRGSVRVRVSARVTVRDRDRIAGGLHMRLGVTIASAY